MFFSLLAPIYLLSSIFSLQHYYRTLRNWTLPFCSAVYILLITEVFFFLPLHCYFFYPSCRPPSSSTRYFLLSLLFTIIPTSVFSSSSVCSVKTHLFLSCCCILFIFYSLSRLSWSYSLFPSVPSSMFPSLYLLFYRVCSSLIPSFFVSSSSSTDIIRLFITSFAFIFFLPISCFFCFFMSHFHSLSGFFCSALTTPLLSRHQFSISSPLLLPLLSCCVILRSYTRKQTFPPRLPCTDVWVKSRNDHVSRYSCSGPIRSPAIVTSRPHCVGQDNGTVSFALCSVPRGRKLKYCRGRSAKVTFISCGNLNLGTFKLNLSRQ